MASPNKRLEVEKGAFREKIPNLISVGISDLDQPLIAMAL